MADVQKILDELFGPGGDPEKKGRKKEPPSTLFHKMMVERAKQSLLAPTAATAETVARTAAPSIEAGKNATISPGAVLQDNEIPFASLFGRGYSGEYNRGNVPYLDPTGRAGVGTPMEGVSPTEWLEQVQYANKWVPVNIGQALAERHGQPLAEYTEWARHQPGMQYVNMNKGMPTAPLGIPSNLNAYDLVGGVQNSETGDARLNKELLNLYRSGKDLADPDDWHHNVGWPNSRPVGLFSDLANLLKESGKWNDENEVERITRNATMNVINPDARFLGRTAPGHEIGSHGYNQNFVPEYVEKVLMPLLEKATGYSSSRIEHGNVPDGFDLGNYRYLYGMLHKNGRYLGKYPMPQRAGELVSMATDLAAMAGHPFRKAYEKAKSDKKDWDGLPNSEKKKYYDKEYSEWVKRTKDVNLNATTPHYILKNMLGTPGGDALMKYLLYMYSENNKGAQNDRAPLARMDNPVA